MGVGQVEVGLDERGMDLQSYLAAQDNLLDTTVDPEREMMGQEELHRDGQPVHPYQDSAAKAGENCSHRNGAQSRLLRVYAILQHELMERVDMLNVYMLSTDPKLSQFANCVHSSRNVFFKKSDCKLCV